MRQREIGEALDGLSADMIARTVELTRQFRAHALIGVLKQAVDTPHRARAQIAAWIVDYNQRNGAGAAQTFLAQCLTASGSAKTLAQIDSALSAAEAQAQILVGHVNNDGWTWDQVASAIEAQFTLAPGVSFEYARLPLPAGYTTVWGEPW